jgi:hypothetical protein
MEVVSLLVTLHGVLHYIIKEKRRFVDQGSNQQHKYNLPKDFFRL